MADPLTELPPPTRFDPDELNSFDAEPLPDLTPPTLLIVLQQWGPSARKQLQAGQLCTDVLVLALSNAGRQLVHSIAHKEIVGSVVQAEISLVGNTLEGGLLEKGCYIYSTDGSVSSLWVSVQYTVPTEHASIWARSLFAGISPRRVIILGDVPREHFRGRLSADEEMIFLLTTDKQKLEDGVQTRAAPYFPSGSLVDGLSAALLTYCQVRSMNGSLLVTAPQSLGPARLAASVTALLEALPSHIPSWSFSADQKRLPKLASEIYA